MARNNRGRRPRRVARSNGSPAILDVTPEPRWVQTFNDDFTAEPLNLTRWASQYPWGRDRSAQGELQWYGEDAFSLADSILTIHATEGGPEGFAYTSGLISTHDFFSQIYGRFEIHCKVPAGQGLWPAFWLLPITTEWPPEIDVLEILGNDPNTVHMFYHALVNGEHVPYGDDFTGPDFSAGFHTFAVEWERGSMIWYVDGVERHRVTEPTPNEPMYMIANLAVGGNWPGPPDETTQFPAAFQIDWIRAYKREW